MGSIRRTKVIEIAKKYADEGYTEEPDNRTIFGEMCDAVGYFAPQKKNGAPWCHTFVDAVFMLASDSDNEDSRKYDAQNYLGQQPSYNNLSCGCTYGAGYFRDIGHYYNIEDAYVGDVIYFGKRGYESHVGIIINLDYDDDGDVSTIYTVEGNKADGVRYGEYDVRSSYIAGVGKPTFFDYYDDLDAKPEPVKESTYNCVDVSEWNGDVDWEQAKANGVEFAIIRCGFGEDNEDKDDKYFHINMENAVKAGVKVGVYFYSYATDYDSACEEGRHCLRLIEPYRNEITFPVFYDVEEERCVPRINDIIGGFTNTLNYYGYNVGVYTSGAWYSLYFRDISVDFIWLAFWGSDDGEPHNKPDYCDIWQYTSKGTVKGISERSVDCDILYNQEMRFLINPEPEPTEQVTITLDVLSIGSTGGQVNTLKALLNQYGWSDNLPLDGDFDYDTEQAVNRLKERYDLTQDGIVDEPTWRLLLL